MKFLWVTLLAAVSSTLASPIAEAAPDPAPEADPGYGNYGGYGNYPPPKGGYGDYKNYPAPKGVLYSYTNDLSDDFINLTENFLKVIYELYTK
ncbi:hypothetical protein MKX08_005252 [Trichoderma sp. CBMAI-0020]|nr:hypothetical protein MKX08_005252 [Trichoderma sp. CBMAI-0020]